MERWEAIVERPIEPGHRPFEKLLQTASVVLNDVTDLAPFETEWVIDTLLYKPVDLLRTIAGNRVEVVWTKALADALKLLADVVARSAYAEKYYEDIVNLCLLGYDSELRKHALTCLIEVIKRSDVGAKNASRHIDELAMATQCRTPLALLVGAICEHHPAVICSDINKIWRTYLVMLDNSKNTDKVTKSILEGVCSLFKHFGEDLPTSELNNFYENLSSKYIRIPGCLSICFEILQSYAGLFRERLSQDKPTRELLWSSISDGSEQATLNVYKTIYKHLHKKVTENIIATEVLPHVHSTHTRVKLTALRILAFANIESFGDLTQHVDIQTLENEFRRDRVTHGNADVIEWCIESKLPNSERLLQAAILFYDKLPNTTRKKIVVNGILNSPNEVRQAAIHFLITKSCDDLEGFTRIWRDLYDPANADDVAVKSEIATRELGTYLETALEMFLEERNEFEELPPKLTSLLLLTSKVVPLTSTPLTKCASLLCDLSESHPTAEVIAALRAVLLNADVEESRQFYKSLRISSCRNEATLHESCLAIVQASDSVGVEASDVLLALQIIFSSDVEPTILGDALKKFDHVLSNNQQLEQQSIADTIYLVEKLRSRGDKTDKQIRVLHRDVLMFLGKHGNTDINNNANDLDNSIIVNLKKSLSLSLPDQGTNYKVNLQNILLLALRHEDPVTLQMLMTMLCSNLSSNKDQPSQLALARVIQTLAKVHACGSAGYTEPIHAAVQLCSDAECVRHMLQYISATLSCGVRRLLAAALSSLCEDPETLQLTVETGGVLLASPEYNKITGTFTRQESTSASQEETTAEKKRRKKLSTTTKKAGLDVAETILTSLENNNALSKIILPQLIVAIAKTYENDTKPIFDVAAKMFVDKKELFEKHLIQETVCQLAENLIKENTVEENIYKSTSQMTVKFIKNLQDVDVNKILNIILDCPIVNVKVLYTLAVMKSEFGFDDDTSRMILTRNSNVLNLLLNFKDKTEMDGFELEAILKLLEEFCQIVLEFKYKETIQLLSEIIIKLTPKLVKKLRKNIAQCFSSFKRHWKETPKQIRNSFQTWTEMLQLKTITDSLEKEYFPSSHILCVNALKIMSNIFDIEDLILSDVKCDIARWPKILLKSYASGRLEQYFYNETSYFNDALTVSLKFLTSEDVKKLIKEGSGLNLPIKDVGILFCGSFVKGFSGILTEKPFILLDNDMGNCSVILNDLVKFYVRKTCSQEECDVLLELVDKLWPTYVQHTTFSQKHSLLVNLECLPKKLGSDATPLQWMLDAICARDTKIEERVKLVAVVPEEALSSPRIVSSVSALFPARFCELRPELLEAVSNKPCVLFVEVLAALVDNDKTPGWWDDALSSCVASLAARSDVQICRALYDKCHSPRVCSRVLAPLLRYSTADLCEKFLATILKKLLSFTQPKTVKPNLNYQKCLEEYMISLHLLLVAFEKLPTSSLESSSSALYSEIPSPTPWHIVRETCRSCHTLRDSMDVSDTPALKDTYREFQCLVYNCYCAAVCRRRPGEKIYAQLLGPAAWARLVDERGAYELPITPSWFKRNKSLPVSVPVDSPALLTSRSHMFLRTLSEHPQLFDLHALPEDVPEVQDISLPETDLNAHPCAATLTALLRHVATLPHDPWPAVVQALEGGRGNLQLLIAQIICNCREELKPHASALVPGLLAAVAGTATRNGQKCLNGLHLDVLDTIIYWREETTSTHFNVIIHHLITTCMEYRRRNTFSGLLKILYGLLELYGSSIQIEWKSFEPYYGDQTPDSNKALIKLIKAICQNKIYIPQLLEKIMAKFDANPIETSECLGLAIAACQIVNEKHEALTAFKKSLSKCNVTTYVRVLHFCSLGYPECFGEQEFRKISDHVTKMTSSDRTKCLNILSGYLSRSRPSTYITDMFDTIDLSEMIVHDKTAMLIVKNGMHLMPGELRRRVVLQISDMCQHSDVKVRKAALEVMLRAFEELFSYPSQPPPKRQKTETTPILNIQDDIYHNTVLSCLGRGASDPDQGVAGLVREGVGGKLDKDLGVRFAECFIITIYLPSLHHTKTLDLCACVSAMLEMLYSHLRSSESFKNMRLREEPLVVREAPGTSKLLTLSKTFQGTFSSYSLSKARRTKKTQGTKETSIDVQVPIDDILGTLLEFAKSSPTAARALYVEALRSVLTSSRFELGSTLCPLVGAVLAGEPSRVTPLCLDVGRVLIGCGNVDSLLAPAERLKTLTAGTEDANLTLLLYEEVVMRSRGDELYQLGIMENTPDLSMDETTSFSIEDLKYTFGKLSSWDALTLQQRSELRAAALPPLWADKREFITHLSSYEVPVDSKCWFDKMAAAFKQEVGPNAMSWLRHIDSWPRRHFEISAITEAVSWRHLPSELKEIQNSIFTKDECLSEWAARLMMRSSYYNSLQHSESDEDKVGKLSRSHELRWCMRANEMGLPNPVLDCVKRNVEDLCKNETLPWLRQKLLALRQIGLERRDDRRLRDVLEKARMYAPEPSTDPLTSIDMFHLMMTLQKDMKSLSYSDVQSILLQVRQAARDVDWSKSQKTAVSSIFDIAMEHYDDSWDTVSLDRDSVLSNMSQVLCQAADLNTPRVDMLLAVLLNRLDEFTGKMDAGASQNLLEKLSPLTPTLDEFTLDLLKKNANKFPSHLLKSHSVVAPQDSSLEKYRRCLQIVCDSGHLMTYYCEELMRALTNKDENLWKVVFDRMKAKIYENPYTGPSYKLLNKYKEELYQLNKYESSPEFSSQAETTLKAIILSLRKEPQTALRLSDLCPALLQLREESSVNKLFGLKREQVVKFFDKVQVFTDSIRRPVVLSFLLSNGRVKRAIHKTGERLAGDAAAQRAGACAQRLCGGGVRGYTVTLLDEESALIEYLERHERLRAVIESIHNINVLPLVLRPADERLVESPRAAALQTHKQLCANVPAYTLRSAIELNSSCVQDFISKKRNFTESLGYMSILIWILGLGDRHLQNIMLSQDGRLRCIDWGDVCRHGAAESPARLTRNMLAVCDLQVLESRLQSTLAALRDSSKLFEAVIKASFKWMGEDFDKKLVFIQQILRGTTLSHQITRQVITESVHLKHKEKHLELLDHVFAGVREGDAYSVEEQVSCLLRHCTSPELLSVVRAGWEPWL